MALTIAIEGNGVLSDAESMSGWGVQGSGGISPVAETDIVLQGSGAVSCKVSGSKNAWLYYDVGSGTELDFTGGGAQEDELVYIWFNVTTIGALDTLANGGVEIRIGSGTSTNYRAWPIGGNDSFANNYTGGWQCAVVDPLTGGNDTGTPDMANARYFGIYITTTVTVKAENLIIDTIAVGKGLRITGTDVTGWQEVADYCNDYSNRAWGMMQERLGIYFVYGTLFVGDTAQSAATSLTDEGRIFRFGDYEYWNGSSFVTTLPTDFNGLTVEDHASWTTTLGDGVIVGSDAGRSGSTWIGAVDADATFDLYGGNNASSVTKFYGSTFTRITGGITWGNDADHHCYSVTLSNCGQFDPVGAVKIRNCVFTGYTLDTDAALLWNSNIDIQKCTFVANTDSTNDPHAIEHPDEGSFVYTDMLFSGNDFDINNSSLAVLVDSYQPTEDGDIDLSGAFDVAVAQQFTGVAGTLSRATFSIRRQGSSATDVIAYLYANSGGQPSGAYLAKSNIILQQDLPSSFADVDFEFEDEYEMSASTEYHIAVEHVDGDGSNYIEVEYLAAGSGSETCNSSDGGSWNSETFDCRFAVNRDGVVKINATDSDPGTAEETAAVLGATIIVNSVNLTVTVKDKSLAAIQDAQTSIQLLNSPYTQLMNEDTTAAGVATEPYNYTGDVDVVVRVRKSDDLDNPRYKPVSRVSKIESGGLSETIIMVEQSAPI